MLDSSWQGVKRLFILAYNNKEDDNKFLLILSKNFFQDLKLKVTLSKLMVEIFIISQLMTQLSNMTKSEKYQQDKVMITQLVVY